MPRKLWYWKVEVAKVLADGGLAMCSLEARGAWWWLLMRMFADGAEGVWEGTMQQLAHAVGAIGHDIQAIYDEWVRAGVGEFESLPDGRVRITSRRMVADAKARMADRERKAKGNQSDPSDFQSDSDSIPGHFRSYSESMSDMTCHDSNSDSLGRKEEAGRKGKETRARAKRHPWPVAMYVERHGTPPPLLFYDQLAQRVTDRSVWAVTLDDWEQSGYRFRNVAGLLEAYERNAKVVNRTDSGGEPMTYDEMIRDAQKHGRTTEEYEPIKNGAAKPKWRLRTA